MAAIPYSRTLAKPLLEQALENALILGWDELMPTAAAGVIHIEYHTGPDRSVDYLKVWASSERGRWSLVCEYWTGSLWSHVPGLTFGKGYRSGDFSRRLESVMQHENAFTKLPRQDGSIQIFRPTESERAAATAWMSETLGNPGFGPGVPGSAA